MANQAGPKTTAVCQPLGFKPNSYESGIGAFTGVYLRLSAILSSILSRVNIMFIFLFGCYFVVGMHPLDWVFVYPDHLLCLGDEVHMDGQTETRK